MDIIIRSAIIFVVMGVVIRVSGKRQIAQLSAFDLILLVTMGDLVGQTILQEDYSLTAGILAVVSFAVLSILMGWLAFFVPGSRALLQGQPTIVIRDGVVDDKVTRHEMLPHAELLEAAREAGIRDLRDVELAVMEVDGSFSFFNRDDGSDDEAEAEPSRAPDRVT